MRQASSALHDIGQHLRLFVEGVRDYAIITLSPDGIVKSWNAGAQAIKGYEADEIVGRHFSIFFTPADIAAGKPAHVLQEAMAQGRFEDTGSRVRKDGSSFWANVVVTPIHAEDGTLLGFGKITRDISDRVAAADRLTSSEARLRTLVDTVLDTLVDGLIVIDRMGRVQVYNRACEKLFGYGSSEVVGHNVKMLMPPDTMREHDQYLRNYQTTGIRKIIGISREVVGQRKDGTTFPMHLAVGEAMHLGEPIYVGIIRDLTERNQVEAQLRQSQKMEAVGQLTGGLAHDFNNILMLISINVEALLEQDVSVRTRDRLEQIEKSAARAAELTQQLLAYSRRQPLRPNLTNLNELVLATSKLLRRTLGEDIEIEPILAEDLWITNVDRTQLETTLVNLSLNARDAMPGGGKLVIETRNIVLDQDYVAQNPDVAAGPYAMLAVTDTGTGIPQDALEKVFEPFFTTKEVGRGTGLGLSMVYGFIKQSNGHIKIYSELDRGTSIKMYLPRADGTAAQEAPADAPSLPLGSESLLVVEDNADVRARICEILRGLGYAVDEAADGTVGLAKFEAARRPYDLLLTDVVMPGAIGGKALADAVASRWPETPVVFMSGYAQDAITHQGRLDAGVRLLAKPFRRHELAQMIRQALDDRPIASDRP
ncbi:PAS domain-containing sensor histidine kinase [uncultured Reyranella sp.]|uniref:hybrid sensor histidine kinase/response regulator n=1 Tax=uncultured Reyranella sp. TaxID=735512 RepID=UPI0025DBB9AF|nr:PAS domain-containing sensor histidine kinase [uncultured Reyranella sp.]